MPRGDSGDRVLRKRLPRGICPVCKQEAAIRAAERITPMVTTLWMHCTNTACGMTWRAAMEFIHVCSPSGLDHGIDLPKAPPDFFRQHAPPGCGPPGKAPDPAQMSIFDKQDGGTGNRDGRAAAA